jgi:hypothetical protein
MTLAKDASHATELGVTSDPNDAHVGFLLSSLIGEPKGRTESGRVCQLLGGLAGLEGPWPDARHMLERINLEGATLTRMFTGSRRRGDPLPDRIVDAFFPNRIRPAVVAAIEAGPTSFVEDVEELLTCWATGLESDGRPREGGPLAESTIKGLLVAARRFARGLTELEKQSQRFGFGDSLSAWIEGAIPAFKSAAELEAVAANRDRSGPPLIVVRRAQGDLTRQIERAKRLTGKQSKFGLFINLRDRALLGVACLGFRKSTIRHLLIEDYIQAHSFPDGRVGPALRLRRLKGLKASRIAGIPEGLAWWIDEYLAFLQASGFRADPGTPLWQPNDRTRWGTQRLPSGNLIHKAVVRALAPFSSGHCYSPHTLRHFAEKWAFLAGLDWLETNRKLLVHSDMKGLPSSPQTFADVLLDHSLHDITDRYKDINSEPGRELWRRETALGMWGYVDGDRGARKAPDVEGIVAAAGELDALLADQRQCIQHMDSLQQQKRRAQAGQSEVVQTALAELGAMEIKDILKVLLESLESGNQISRIADEMADESRRLSDLGGEIERARHKLENARARRVPVPDDTPDDELEWDESLLVPDEEQVENTDPATVVRRWFDPNEFRWAFGELLISPATLRRYMRGQLPYPPGDTRNIFEPHPNGGRPLCVERLSERRQRILRDALPLERYHSDIVARLDWLMTQPWPAPIHAPLKKAVP